MQNFLIQVSMTVKQWFAAVMYTFLPMERFHLTLLRLTHAYVREDSL